MRDTTRSFAKMAMHALIQRVEYPINAVELAWQAWWIAEEMEREAIRLDKKTLIGTESKDTEK